MILTGIGYDSHRLVENREFILAGVKIPYNKGFLAHSDGDVFTHALIDALLGASGLGDIGELFPNTDEKYKEANSLNLLSLVKEKLDILDIKIIYIDSIIIAERPKITSYKLEMKANISRILDITKTQINIKAKTNEQMDDIGKGDGVAVHVVVTIDRNFN